ncbi:MAG: aminoacyl-tRNA hydrolase [Oscillospiraceae bacterium]|nr:aminoacyl-tRNA hydrolase [Oscillospiraceae bacterium]
MFNKKPKSADFLVVGLGNPGKKYELTRHNIGFMALDSLMSSISVDKKMKKWEGELYFSKLNGKNIIFLKPLTFMNLSGNCVSAVMNFYKIPIENIIVISDDISLSVGKIRIRRSGSHGGHNGLRDIILKIGSDNFKRIKIGVGERTNPDYDLADWVLSRFKSDEISLLQEKFSCLPQTISLIADGKIDEAMSKFNG